jgi:ubiquinone/menaquinone biosynthesis C-methylase UbiE
MASKLVWQGGERRIPKKYDGFSALLKSCVMSRLRYVLPYVKMNYNIVDLGCGTGWNTKYVSLYCTYIWGVDISKEAIEYAQYINDAKNITWLQRPMHALDNFEESSMDMIMTIAAIEHASKTDMEKVFSEAYRILKPNTYLVGTATQFRNKPKVNATPWHKYEPGFDDFKKMAAPYFEIKTLKNFTMTTPDLARPTTEGLFIFRSKKTA